jgi:outer membrane protein assembly factor BamB
MVHAIDANTGKTLWSYTAGGRVDSPPTIWQGRVLFGSADGCVYCLRAADGALVWRFRAAPFDERLTAAGQVESVWPVHGSVLVWEGIVYCVAGRAMWLDGGLRLLRIDATSGRKLSETLLDDTDPRSGENLQTDLRWPNLPVALPDILSCDGRYVYMRSQPFDLEGNRTEVITPRDYTDQRGDTAHLFSATGFLDDSFWHRSYWMWGKSFISGAGGWYLAGYQAPAGNILAVDGSKVYGFGYAPLRFTGTPKLYHVFACDREPEIVADPKVAPRTRGASVFGQVVPSRLEYDWSQSAPLIGKALVVAGDNLFLAGPPALVDETEVYLDYGNAAVQAKMAEHVAAFEGRKGGLLVAVSKADGQQSAAWRLESPPVFDGMIAAGGRLYLATMNGKIVCLGSGERTPLPAAPDAKLGPLPIAPGSAAVVPTKSHPDFQQLVAIQVGTSDLGYRMRTAPGGVGLALKKLPSPIAKRAVFSAKVRPTPGALSPDKPGNGFLVFGDGPGDEHLIKCGFRVSGKVLMVVQGPLAGSRGKSKKVDVKADEVAELRATVDLESQTITASMLGETLEVPLERPIDSVTWAGYGIASVTTDFGPMEIAGD